MLQMRQGDHQFVYKFYFITPQMFDKLTALCCRGFFNAARHFIREHLEPGERLALTLSYLASGQDICSVVLTYRVGVETARTSIHLTCRAIRERLKGHVMKGTLSIVITAVVDSTSKFVLVDVGTEGCQSDGGVFKNAEFGKALTKGQLDIPSVGQLPGTTKVAPYAFVRDEAFQLRRDFMHLFLAKHLEE
ncbi:hypothetical protein HPB48_003539 [Haemaphysalis longicornis]|uniref:DDE Tnp4 domain-containing protein n=1 Tax=Haemaphysalis longicornis TaxID=44386 RepID=A0A9J6GH35_HAELO|nr:hypothetical protein HPB48_003539 [Haemaphysalis longicornis]